MDEQEYKRLKNASRMLALKLNQNRTVNHMSSVSLHLHAITCGHADAHFCVGVDIDGSALLGHSSLEIPEVWEGLPVYIFRGRVVAAGGTLKKDWFDQNSYERTIKNFLETSDPDWIAGHNAEDMAKGLCDELRFIGCYSPEDLPKVQVFINEHKEELHAFILEYLANKQRQ